MEITVELVITDLQQEIEELLGEREPAVEVLLAEVVNGNTLRIFVDHPEGVSLGICEQVTRHLSPYREQYRLEVSSPGLSRPLTRPAHFQRYLGNRAKFKLVEAHEGQKNFIGELVSADDSGVTVAADAGVLRVEYDDIRRSNLIAD